MIDWVSLFVGLICGALVIAGLLFTAYVYYTVQKAPHGPL